MCYNFFMNRGFSYLQLLTSLGIFVILSTIFAHLFFPALHKSLMAFNQLKQERQIQECFNILSSDLSLATHLQISAQQVSFTKNNLNYTYLINNGRLARKKDGLLYLTPKEWTCADLVAKNLNPNLLELQLKINDQLYTRVIREIN